MKDRLKILRKALNLNQQEFADRIGINRGTLANYEVGRNVPIDAVIKLICDTFHVSESWLRDGTGEMFVSTSEYDEIKDMVDAMLLDETADIKRRLVAAILRMSPEQIRLAVEWIKETFNLVDAPKEVEPAAAADKAPAEPHVEAEAVSISGEKEKRLKISPSIFPSFMSGT